MSAPRVSVVIPTYSRHRSLGETLAALAAQDMRDFEIVVVDDGSAPPVKADIVPSNAALDVRIINQENAGPSAARNRGAREARGKILAFTDDDCRPRPQWLARLTKELASHPQALVGSLTCNGLPGNNWSTTSQLIVDLVYEHFNADPENAYFLTSNNFACARELFLETGGFDTEFALAGAEDRDFCDRWRTAQRPIQLIPEPLVDHYHAQTFRKFLDLHYRYGRGAYLYQAKRKRRGSGTMADDLGFHRALLRSIPRRLKGSGLAASAGLLFGLGLWQIANLAGFVSAASES